VALKLTMTCGEYDRTRALIDGMVKPEGIDLEVHANSRDPQRQLEVQAGKYDVAEFYAGHVIADIPYRSLGLTAIPIYVKRMLRHSYTYVNTQKGIRTPADLNGRRVGIQDWLSTTVLWVVGMLEDEHGLDGRTIEWTVERQDRIGAWQPPAWARIEPLPAGASMHDRLASGELDAVITTHLWAPDGHPNIGFLFPNYSELERDYYRRTHYFPIMHLLVIRTAVLEQHPWVAMSMFQAWRESKRRCYEWLERQRVHQTALWFRALWEEERAAAGPDPYVWGFQQTRDEVDKLLEYAHRQGVTERRHAPEELFHASTLAT
jgi:4,5-dihydroxyphthalate decarboxylase